MLIKPQQLPLSTVALVSKWHYISCATRSFTTLQSITAKDDEKNSLRSKETTFIKLGDSASSTKSFSAAEVRANKSRYIQCASLAYLYLITISIKSYINFDFNFVCIF